MSPTSGFSPGAALDFRRADKMHGVVTAFANIAPLTHHSRTAHLEVEEEDEDEEEEEEAFIGSVCVPPR